MESSWESRLRMAKVVTWNARGLCNLDAQGSIRLLLIQTKADVIMIQETKTKEKDVIARAKFMWPKEWMWEFVPSIRLSGGMIMAWNPDVVEMKASLLSKFSISISCTIRSVSFDCMLTWVYGPSDKRFLGEFWEELHKIRMWCAFPWCIGGDFNIICFTYEKRGGNALTRPMRQFAEFEDKYGLVEHFLEGAMYTWSNNQCHPVMSKLDRFITSVDWELFFGGSRQQALPKYILDHRAILFESVEMGYKKRPFWFEIMWLEDKSLGGLIKTWWEEFHCDGTPSFVWWLKLKNIKAKLKKWNKEVFTRESKYEDRNEKCKGGRD